MFTGLQVMTIRIKYDNECGDMKLIITIANVIQKQNK